MKKRTFAEIAQEIKHSWKNIYFGAKPYVEALLEIDSTDPKAPYWCEDAQSMVCGFFGNCSSWRGEDAKRIKAELKSMIK